MARQKLKPLRPKIGSTARKPSLKTPTRKYKAKKTSSFWGFGTMGAMRLPRMNIGGRGMRRFVKGEKDAMAVDQSWDDGENKARNRQGVDILKRKSKPRAKSPVRKKRIPKGAGYAAQHGNAGFIKQYSRLRRSGMTDRQAKDTIKRNYRY